VTDHTHVLLAAAAPRLGQADVPIIVMGRDDDPSYPRRASGDPVADGWCVRDT